MTWTPIGNIKGPPADLSGDLELDPPAVTGGGDQPARPATSATKTGHTEPGVASPPTATEPSSASPETTLHERPAPRTGRESPSQTGCLSSRGDTCR
jgi:hypothetical protein